MCSDSRRSAYIAGVRGLTSLDSTGRFVKKLESATGVRNVGIACGGEFLYVVSPIWSRQEDIWNFALYIYDVNFTTLRTVSLNITTRVLYSVLCIELMEDLIVVPMYQTVRPEGIKQDYPDSG